MNIQAYIESGILEEYVLGTVSPQEKQEVECMSHIYPEIKEELLRTESALEEYALKHQTAPPASLKDSIFAQMNFDSTDSAEVSDEETTNSEDIRNGEFVEIPVTAEEAPIVTDVFSKTQIREVTPFWAKLAVAATVLLALFAGWAATEVSGTKKSNEALASEIQELKKTTDYSQQLAAMYRDQRYKVIRLAGLPKSPESSVAAFWDPKTNEVMLDVKKLPPAPAGKQYQLWSIVDGKPMDNGMLDDEFENKLLRMKETRSGAVAFAITLEKEGGNPTPTMEEMYVMGEV
ncbi:anti-sigma factor domain-containing protein [Dyadobacter sp. CY312]|uniref:anti-sigma factor n=1 Tax=Dyadobacter sp. CY312 TaxID=2907303 RepID=UPI001F2F778E|nr:anti-sigma factor [Dyadobacter sp. CY312]MCE7041208.1 anti-sigma factor [Dyadobacter sp. CY312]